jgi:hypothetical protein
MAVTAAATMTTNPITLKNQLVDMPVINSASPKKNPTPAAAARRLWTRRLPVPRKALTSLGSSAANAASI